MLDLFLSYAGGTDAFEAGFFRWHRRGHVPVPVRAWYGPPRDPVDGSVLDRSWRWQFQFNGVSLEAFADELRIEPEELIARFWPVARDDRVDEAEYRYLVDTIRHARAHDPHSPFSAARGKVDLLSATIPTVGG